MAAPRVGTPLDSDLREGLKELTPGPPNVIALARARVVTKQGRSQVGRARGRGTPLIPGRAVGLKDHTSSGSFAREILAQPGVATGAWRRLLLASFPGIGRRTVIWGWPGVRGRRLLPEFISPYHNVI